MSGLWQSQRQLTTLFYTHGRVEQLKIEQVRKRGLLPPLPGLDKREQAPLPDLFYVLFQIPRVRSSALPHDLSSRSVLTGQTW